MPANGSCLVSADVRRLGTSLAPVSALTCVNSELFITTVILFGRYAVRNVAATILQEEHHGTPGSNLRFVSDIMILIMDISAVWGELIRSTR